MLLCSNIIFLN